MTGKATRLKVACYVTQGNRLLIFDHPRYPEAGAQIPAGSMEPGESPEAAALRETREESGLQNLIVRADLGMKEYDLSPLGRDEIHRRNYFHLECLEPTPDRWSSYEQTPSDGSPGPIELEFYWIALSGISPLSGWLDDYLPQLKATMNPTTLLDIVYRSSNPIPWSEGDNIPWNDPGFSARMLDEHLSQAHDAASRRTEKIERHIAWIHAEALGGKTGKLLDLGCGPGLYASRLARLGHQVTGVDYSPASIHYAQELALEENLACDFIHADIREAEYGHAYQAAMLIFGELNVFRPMDIRSILRKIHTALEPGGLLILEPHTYEAVLALGRDKSSWYAEAGGLFSDRPHLVLEEHFWEAQHQVATIRYFVIDASSGNVIRYAQSMQAYTPEAYRKLLAETGFSEIRFYPSLTGSPDPEQGSLMAITALKA